MEDWSEKKERYLGLFKKGHSISDRRRRCKSGSLRSSRSRSRTESRSSSLSSSRSRSRSRSPLNLKSSTRRSRERSRSRKKGKHRYREGRARSKTRETSKKHSRRHVSTPSKRKPEKSEGNSESLPTKEESPKKSSSKEECQGESTAEKMGKDPKYTSESTAGEKNQKFQLELLRKHLLKELDKLDQELLNAGQNTTPEIEKEGMESDSTLIMSSPVRLETAKSSKDGVSLDSDEEAQSRKRNAKSESADRAGTKSNRKLKINPLADLSLDNEQSIYNLEERDEDMCMSVQFCPRPENTSDQRRENCKKSPCDLDSSENVQSIYEVEENMNIAIELNLKRTKLELDFGKKSSPVDLSLLNTATEKLSSSNVKKSIDTNTTQGKENRNMPSSTVVRSPISKEEAPVGVGMAIGNSEKRASEEKIITTLKLLCNLKDIHPQLASEVVSVYNAALRLRSKGENPTKCLEDRRNVIVLRRVCTELQASIVLGNVGNIQKIFRGEIVKLVEDTLESYLVATNRFLYDLDIRAIAQCTFGGSKADIVRFIRDALVCSAVHIPTVENLAGILDAVLKVQSEIESCGVEATE